MKKEIVVVIALLAVGAILFSGAGNLQDSAPDKDNGSLASLARFSLPFFGASEVNKSNIATEAWQTFENYMEAARTHNFETIKSLSHQLSPACSDPSRIEECNALMDSVYGIASYLEQSNFKYIEADSRQVVMWTDGPGVSILYFTRAGDESLRVLGLQFCIEIESGDPCVDQASLKTDSNSNGWWDRVEELFY